MYSQFVSYLLTTLTLKRFKKFLLTFIFIIIIINQIREIFELNILKYMLLRFWGFDTIVGAFKYNLINKKRFKGFGVWDIKNSFLLILLHVYIFKGCFNLLLGTKIKNYMLSDNENFRFVQ